MRPVHPIKIADTDKRRVEVGWDIGEFVEDLHATTLPRPDAISAEKLLLLRRSQRLSYTTLNFEFQPHSVVSQLYIWRQFSIRFLMGQVMADVRKKRSLRLDFTHDL
jgi:hypothetical protein